MIFPLIDTMRLSMFTIGENGGQVFVGLQNIVRLLTDPSWHPRFFGALKNNFVFWGIQALFQDTIGLLLATLLSMRYLRGRAIFRTFLFMPTVLSVIIVGFIWQLILNPVWGVTEHIMGLVGLGKFYAPWLGLESSALIAVSFISMWQWMGMPMMLFYAALISIPEELLEAAIVDGANGWNLFWRIKFPLILPVIGMVFTLTFVSNFNAFGLVYSIQGILAGPNFSTDLLGTLFYRTFFGAQLQLGDPSMGAAVATMMFLVVLTGVLIYYIGWRRRVTTYEF
jgi:raffinose/stachyose/melibiose transport system permease protein